MNKVQNSPADTIRHISQHQAALLAYILVASRGPRQQFREPQAGFALPPAASPLPLTDYGPDASAFGSKY